MSIQGTAHISNGMGWKRRYVRWREGARKWNCPENSNALVPHVKAGRLWRTVSLGDFVLVQIPGTYTNLGAPAYCTPRLYDAAYGCTNARLNQARSRDTVHTRR